MANCSEACGYADADIPKPNGLCEKLTRNGKLKALLMQVCESDPTSVTPPPGWSENSTVKTAWLTARLNTFTSLHNLRSMIINPVETSEVKILACEPANDIVTKQTIDIEDVVMQTNDTDQFLDYTLWRFLQDGIRKLNLIAIDCDDNLHPWVVDFRAAAPKRAIATGKFWREDEEVSDCKSIEVKKGTISVCHDIRKFNTPWLLGSEIPDGVRDVILPG